MDRRVFVSGLGALAVAPPVAANLLAKLDPVELVAYRFLSEFLTGIPATILSPDIAPDDVPPEQIYLSHLRAGCGAKSVTQYLKTFLQKNQARADSGEIADALLLRTSSAFKGMSRLTMKMWLLGMWFGANETRLVKQKAYQRDMVISGRTYAQALAWRIGQGHPPGVSNLLPANWAARPNPAP